MRAAHPTRRPVGRLLAAALLAVLCTTSVHGAASPAVPPGAIATAHASIAAALVQQHPTTGRGDQVVGPERAGVPHATEELLPPDVEWQPAARPAPGHPVVGAAEPAQPAGPHSAAAPPSQVVSGRLGRAPPS
ncbi:hypothetical protein O7627_10380 [Solwaraspora sp. WMMD1047]|uniref:hypothetical protein n=1 Tax=Solwaraspora sp. WMMD1047 TaxID=3016102 RepID=UPI002416ACDE|nr:hypothetical protein [Solwaraspora sp. WMMD1047]MDG4829709.1 hypothetical protein [Solwaraspora sp. WMMD1047]